ncbi:DUF2807 domain-containing protein [Segetibacter sp. 3557_3]|uniref:head GIN domain-containing protein n=1 Tax=Segetibacter sp. 3557_3 TaxID=2547429 RepID=UPI001058AD15|nr:head GIN domain-containing protein [Segetibacter sp. 3557_3]TDH26458.1 DUF2807 domain-containing protein [Segetibacter sp. 3557_3]
MRILYPCLALFLMIAVVSCFNNHRRVNGNGKAGTQTRSVSGVTEISLTAGIDVELSSGETSVRLEGDENILPYVETVVKNGELVIRYRRNVRIETDNPVKVYVSTPTLNSVEISGGGNVTGEDKWSSKQPMRFSISGSGDIYMIVNTPRVRGNISGSGNLNLAGETKDVEVDISGSGNYRGKGLKAEVADINIVGSGDAETFADVALKAKIVGSGSIRYAGNADVSKNITGSGSVDKVSQAE